MWTCRRSRPRPALSDWELAELAERMRHAVRLVGRGVPVAVAAGECGVGYETLRKAARRGVEA